MKNLWHIFEHTIKTLLKIVRIQKKQSRLYFNTVKHDNLKYQRFIQQREPYPISLAQSPSPLISILMPTHNSNIHHFSLAIQSVLEQGYPNWELCIADDGSQNHKIKEEIKKYLDQDKRIKAVFLPKQRGISQASNAAATIAQGDWLTFIDHDDMLHPQALESIIEAIQSNPDAKLIYSDEDKIDENNHRFSPHFKPDWNPDLFFSQNYIAHIFAIRRDVFDKTEGFCSETDGAQDYDIILQALHHIHPSEIIHIPRVLYHWRISKNSTAQTPNAKPYTTIAGIKALERHFSFSNKPEIVIKEGLLPNTYKVCYPLHKQPKVSIIIPTRDKHKLLKHCIESILKKTTYQNYDITIIDNHSKEKETLEYFKFLKTNFNKKIQIISYPHPFNYSALNNYAVDHVSGEIVALLNNDIEIISKGWLTEMVQHAIRQEIGIVGAKLYYDNDTIQHAGVILGIGGVAGHGHKYFPKKNHGYFSRLKVIQNYSAVTGACMVMRKSVFLECGGLDAHNLTVAFNDVDLCLKALFKGYRNLWTPYAEAYHHESKSRGKENTPSKQKRFRQEIEYMQKTYKNLLLKDPCYNKNLTLKHEDFRLCEEEVTQNVT
jgi:GT2 family glycosyltransferase